VLKVARPRDQHTRIVVALDLLPAVLARNHQFEAVSVCLVANLVMQTRLFPFEEPDHRHGVYRRKTNPL
jgi:hypothetical protein